MRKIEIPIPKLGGFRVFELFPVILAIAVTWIYAIIVTEGMQLLFPFLNFQLIDQIMQDMLLPIRGQNQHLPILIEKAPGAYTL